MKGHFFIKAKDANVITEKGVRIFLLERLFNSPFKKGAVFNVDDKTVEVQLEGSDEQIKKFKEQLEKDFLAKFGNPVITFSEFEETKLLEIPSLIESSQALMLGQLSKGIDVQLDILDTLKLMKQNMGSMNQSMSAMNNNTSAMSSSMNAMSTAIGTMSSSVNVMNQNLSTMHQDLKILPKELAKAIKEE